MSLPVCLCHPEASPVTPEPSRGADSMTLSQPPSDLLTAIPLSPAAPALSRPVQLSFASLLDSDPSTQPAQVVPPNKREVVPSELRKPKRATQRAHTTRRNDPAP